MSIEMQLLQAVRESPADDTPRLIMADWYEEHGDPRGAFIRAQIEMARCDEDSPAWQRAFDRWCGFTSVSDEWLGALNRGSVLASHFERGFVESVEVRLGSTARNFDKLYKSPLVSVIKDLCIADAKDAALVKMVHDSPWIAGVENLQLECEVNEIAGDALSISRNLGGLHTLQFQYGLYDDGLAALARADSNLTGLRSLEIIDSQITAEGIEALAGSEFASRLNTLQIIECPVGDQALVAIARSEHLRLTDLYIGDIEFDDGRNRSRRIARIRQPAATIAGRKWRRGKPCLYRYRQLSAPRPVRRTKSASLGASTRRRSRNSTLQALATSAHLRSGLDVGPGGVGIRAHQRTACTENDKLIVRGVFGGGSRRYCAGGTLPGGVFRMTTASKILSALRRKHRDETAWLVAADWYEEHGDPRAEFIRAQVTMSKHAPESPAWNKADKKWRKQANLLLGDLVTTGGWLQQGLESREIYLASNWHEDVAREVRLNHPDIFSIANRFCYIPSGIRGVAIATGTLAEVEASAATTTCDFELREISYLKINSQVCISPRKRR